MLVGWLVYCEIVLFVTSMRAKKEYAAKEYFSFTKEPSESIVV